MKVINKKNRDIVFRIYYMNSLNILFQKTVIFAPIMSETLRAFFTSQVIFVVEIYIVWFERKEFLQTTVGHFST